ncbi:MAG: hypothetical protein WBX38_17780 [Candidatus Sulfotelmatobacter sp.]
MSGQSYFMWNHRKVNDGERTILAVKAAVHGVCHMSTKKPVSKPKQSGTPPGPKPDVLKLIGNWREAIKKSLEKKKPATGWPKAYN